MSFRSLSSETVTYLFQFYDKSSESALAERDVFAEPLIITACEFLEQNASNFSLLPCLVLNCKKGESKFKPLYNPFLCTLVQFMLKDSLQAVVTNHLVVRGSYRSLSLMEHRERFGAECLSSVDIVSLPLAAVDVPVEVKRLLQLLVKVFDQLATNDVSNNFVDTVVSEVSSYVADNVDFSLKNKLLFLFGHDVQPLLLCCCLELLSRLLAACRWV
ncbi:hypothetical protein HID58_003967 [Brassica napus]|uniref:Uncharacterized protein n=2 Tax=Brassica napus TaxID=3708 RepID=A0ABQ7XJQ1_BRANA|nr:hypothetical protein HID58_004042 [Brassica napus]KAH0855702.1 hypothetical protein HID58_003967 [Brassica napus]CAF2374008.1 unnamed protein product [Brassica napus]CDY34953.1 BnaA01g32840D [Brassica napus]